jgi:hypothetical protein
MNRSPKLVYPEQIERMQAENERLRSALTYVRSIIKDGAMTGFNPLDGDWAERLFKSQALTHDVLNIHKREAE